MRDPCGPGDGSLLLAAIETHHPDPFRAISRDVLRRQAAAVDALDAHDRSVLTVELMRTLALLGPRNGHTAIHPVDDHPTTSSTYPLRLYEFDDGMFVIAAERGDLVGAELLAVGGAHLNDVLAAVTPLIAHDNDWTICARRPAFVVDATVLRGLDLGDPEGRATFRLRSPTGSVVSVALDAIATRDYGARVAGGDRVPHRPQAAYLRRRDERHWVEPTACGRAVHVGYNVTRGDLTEFVGEVEALAAAPSIEGVVLDLRLNGGGDNRTYGPLLGSLQRLGHDKRIAVLTSRTTFSAAMQLVVDLERRTSASFVGEPTGGSPNHYGDATLVGLPNSGLNAHVATMTWMTAGEDDERLTSEPDILVPHESTAFFAGDDPTLDAALATLC